MEIKKEDAKTIMEMLRWKEDMAIINHDGEHVFLKACYYEGKRIGITDCCFMDNPCNKHKERVNEN